MNHNTGLLSVEERKDLQFSIRQFLTWMREKGIPIPLGECKFEFVAATEEDWTMRVKDGDPILVEFNPQLRLKCTPEYFKEVVLHECLHVLAQKLPNKDDAKRLKDDFGEPMMKFLDIEADYMVAMFAKEVRKRTLVSYLRLAHQGSGLFGDPKIRTVKVERFLGSLLSIANGHLGDPRAQQESSLFLPNISNIPTEGRLHVIIANRSSFVVAEIMADMHDFTEVKDCYTRGSQYTVRGYSERLLKFCGQALQLQVPPEVWQELEALN